MELNNIARSASSIIRRPRPFPGDELRQALEILIRLTVESCRKARDLGREHGRSKSSSKK